MRKFSSSTSARSQQRLERRAGRRRLQVERDRLLVAVAGQEVRRLAVRRRGVGLDERRPPAAGVVAGAGGLDLDHPRARGRRASSPRADRRGRGSGRRRRAPASGPLPVVVPHRRVRATPAPRRGAAQVTSGATTTMRHAPDASAFEDDVALLLVGVGDDSAPLVENGLQSTTDDEIASATTSPTAPTWPVSRNGTASGISAPRMPVVDAKAETTAPIRQIRQRGDQRARRRRPPRRRATARCPAPAAGSRR